jgi:hypothetical protein
VLLFVIIALAAAPNPNPTLPPLLNVGVCWFASTPPVPQPHFLSVDHNDKDTQRQKYQSRVRIAATLALLLLAGGLVRLSPDRLFGFSRAVSVIGGGVGASSPEMVEASVKLAVRIERGEPQGDTLW